MPDLAKGRKNWDKPHTEAVVYWTKKLLDSLPHLDSKVLVTAAYAHDWGYMGLFTQKTTYGSVQANKALHMKIGEEKIRKLLTEEFSHGYSQAQIDRVSHLVLVHDLLDQVAAEDEITLVEADTLGALDVDKVKPTYSFADNKIAMVEMSKRRRPLFNHALAIKSYSLLIEKRMLFYQNKT